MYKAVFIDIDGTLITSDHGISDATVNTIRKLKEKGIIVILVSARPLSGMIEISGYLGLLSYPLVSLNGAYISLEGEIIFDSVIDPKISKTLHEFLKKYDATAIYYHHDMWFSELQNGNTDYEQKITSVPITIQPFNHTLQSWQHSLSGPNKILAITRATETFEIQDHLKSQFMQHLNAYTSKPTYVEIINNNASKVNAVRLLIERYNIKREEIIAIGDNFNDKDMIEFAGIGIAMGNSPSEVKAVADFTTDTNNNNGVSKALKKIIDL